MNTQQLVQVLQTDRATKPYFQGVFPSDQLPLSISHYPAAVVANVDPKGQPGSHWCAFYFTKDRKGEFFDSYGLQPKDYTFAFQDFLTQNSRTWTYNKKHLQSIDSNVCGHYCLYFLIHRCRNLTMKHIVARFKGHLQQNDRFVYRFITKHFGHIYHNIKKHVAHQTSGFNKKHV